jgi:2,4-dienoyl-CoA reductase-like NADH-dependent reductase (Old Yellow Enzyme family)
MSTPLTSAVDPAAILAQPLTLPCGTVLANRLVKAAMSEQLGTAAGAPTEGLARLYRRWAEGGAGVVVTGNVMIDPAHLGEPRNVVVADARDLDALRAWAAAGASCAQRTGSQLWMQLNHPGRQALRALVPHPVAPSAIPIRLGGAFAMPRALTPPEIEGIVAAFATAAGVALEAGFAGVQLHGAHGYLISQFLSPLANRRDDAWGGDAARRMRFLLETVRAVRARVGPRFPISVKLNSADFQRGGMEMTDSMAVAAALAEAGIDLLEISGGTYEHPVMMEGSEPGAPMRESTRAREAYFIEYARRVRGVTGALPLMVTGGFRTAAGMAAAVAEGAADLIGLARPLTLEPDLPRGILAGEVAKARITPKKIGWRPLDGLAEIQWHEAQMHRMAAGLDPAPRLGVLRVMATSLARDGWRLFRRRRG